MPIAKLTSVHILSVRIDDVTYKQVLEHIQAFIAAGELRQLATVNVEFIMEARRNPAFRQVLADCALCVPDGVGVVWASRRLGKPVRQRVAGVDLVEHIAARAAQSGWRIYFLGAAPGIAEQTAQILSKRYPGLPVAGCYAGSPDPSQEDAIIERVKAAQPDVLFVAYGAPRQDFWCARNQTRIGVPVALGVGGSFDFISGVTQRAPRWMQRLCLEWLHRLIRQPWRLRRQIAIPYFMYLVLFQAKSPLSEKQH